MLEKKINSAISTMAKALEKLEKVNEELRNLFPDAEEELDVFYQFGDGFVFLHGVDNHPIEQIDFTKISKMKSYDELKEYLKHKDYS